MKCAHLVTGIILLIIFAVSGQYMIHGLELPEQELSAQRMMYRASHIYLLFIGSMNVALGFYWRSFACRISRIAQYIASALILCAQPVFIIAFLKEPATVDIDRLFTLTGCLLLLGGIVINVFGFVVSNYSAKDIQN